MEVQELVAHILHHVDAEATDSDPSQAPGVTGRAQYVRNVVSSFVADVRDLPIDEVLEEISAAASHAAPQAAFKRLVENMQGEARPQLAIQEWVGKNRETRGG